MGQPVWQASELTVHWEQDAQRSLRCTRFHESWAHTVSRNGYVFCFLEKKKHLFTQKATISWQRSWTGLWTLFPALPKWLCHIRFPLLPCFKRMQTKIKYCIFSMHSWFCLAVEEQRCRSGTFQLVQHSQYVPTILKWHPPIVIA